MEQDLVDNKQKIRQSLIFNYLIKLFRIFKTFSLVGDDFLGSQDASLYLLRHTSAPQGSYLGSIQDIADSNWKPRGMANTLSHHLKVYLENKKRISAKNIMRQNSSELPWVFLIFLLYTVTMLYVAPGLQIVFRNINTGTLAIKHKEFFNGPHRTPINLSKLQNLYGYYRKQNK